MSLFGKTEVNPNMIPFIQKGEGVGIVKVDGYGKSSARMESYKLILESYSDKHPIIESISAITYLSYDKGNFFSEPKLEIGIAHKKYILAGVENNDEELEAFYETLLDIKNTEKEHKKTSRHGMIGSNSLNNKSQEDVIVDDFDDDILDSRDQKQVDLEKEVINNDSKFSGLTNRIKNVKGNAQEQDDLEIDEKINEAVTKEQITAAPLTGSDDEIEETLASVEKESNKSRFSRFTSKLKNVKNDLEEEISLSDEDETADAVESVVNQSVDEELDEIEQNIKSTDSKSKSGFSAFTSKFRNSKNDSEEENTQDEEENDFREMEDESSCHDDGGRDGVRNGPAGNGCRLCG